MIGLANSSLSYFIGSNEQRENVIGSCKERKNVIGLANSSQQNIERLRTSCVCQVTQSDFSLDSRTVHRECPCCAQITSHNTDAIVKTSENSLIVSSRLVRKMNTSLRKLSICIPLAFQRRTVETKQR